MKREEWGEQVGNLFMDERGRIVYYHGLTARWYCVNVGVTTVLLQDFTVVGLSDNLGTKLKKIEEYLSTCKCFFSSTSFEDVDAVYSALFSSSLESKDDG